MKKLLGILLISVAYLFVSATNPATKGYQVGDVAIDFNLKNIDNKMVSLSSFEDAKGFIVIFTCNTCPVAKKYEDRIIALNEKYASQGYPVIAINPNDPDIQPGDSFAAMKDRAADKGFTFPYLFDAEQSVYPVFGATKTPHVYLLNSQRVVKYIGAIDDSPQSASAVEETYLEDAIEALKGGNDPDPNFTKAIGCSIKARRA